jgi:hypothetical protein
MNIKEIVEAYLKENKCDGLLDTDYGCTCMLGDLMPCDPDIRADCQAAYKHKCQGADKCKDAEGCEGERNDKGIVEDGCMTLIKPEEAKPCKSQK